MNQFSIAFPEGSVVCNAGDYLVCQCSATEWRVYRVEDILLIKRLVPFKQNPSILLIEEHMLDSMTPAYFNEVQLLLTVTASVFADELKALQAIQLQTLDEQTQGVLRPAHEFSESDCRVFRLLNPGEIEIV